MTISHDSSGGPDSVTRPYDAEETASHAVIEALADLEGVRPTTVHSELGISLYEFVDPERLDALLASGDGLAVTFEIDARETYAVEIVGGEHVSVARTA